MPTYTYECPFCLRLEDAVRRIDERDDAPECHRRKMVRRIMPTAVKVFAAYTTPCFDKESGERVRINSRAEHEAFLRRNGLEEVGNDRRMAPKHSEEVRESHARQRKEMERDAANIVTPEEAMKRGLVSEDISV